MSDLFRVSVCVVCVCVFFLSVCIYEHSYVCSPVSIMCCFWLCMLFWICHTIIIIIIISTCVIISPSFVSFWGHVCCPDVLILICSPSCVFFWGHNCVWFSLVTLCLSCMLSIIIMNEWVERLWWHKITASVKRELWELHYKSGCTV